MHILEKNKYKHILRKRYEFLTFLIDTGKPIISI